MIGEIIYNINLLLKGIAPDEKIFGIAQQILRINTKDEQEFIPGIVKKNGDIEYVGIDDVYSIMIYHKINTSNFTYPQRSGYGDQRDNQITYSSIIISTWDMRKIDLINADMQLLIQSRLPQQISMPDVKSVVITPSSSNLNTRQVFQSEYQYGQNKILPEFIQMIQLSYSIEIKYDQNCISKCFKN